MGGDRDRLIAAYAELEELGALELELARAGDVDRLDEVQRRRGELIASLPGQAPAEARGHLERAAALQSQIVAELGFGLERARVDLARLDQGRRTVRGYAPPAGARQASVDHAA